MRYVKNYEKNTAIKTQPEIYCTLQYVIYLKLCDCAITFFASDAVLASVEAFHLIIQFTDKRHQQSPITNLNHNIPNSNINASTISKKQKKC